MTNTNDDSTTTERISSLAPETRNSAQSEASSQAQRVAAQAKERRNKDAGPTESRKPASPGVDNVAGNETDMIDEMRDMEDSGRIDNGSFAGEPNHDDNPEKYAGKEAPKR